MAKDKPAKPYPDFPLFPHAAGQWAKKIRGKLRYFGVWADPQAALQKYLRTRDDLQAGREPVEDESELTTGELVNEFLHAKRLLLDAGEMVSRTWQCYQATCRGVIAYFGAERRVTSIRPRDFTELRAALSARKQSPVSLGNEIQRVRSLVKFAFDAGLIATPTQFGPTFRKPSRKTVRQAKQAAGERMFEADEIRRLLEHARQPLKAMILLGVNCGFGQTDIAELPLSAVDLQSGWIDFPRPKTAVMRRCPLWPETIAALQAALDQRPLPRTAQLQHFVFLTKYGLQWVRANSNGTHSDGVGKEFAKLLKALEIKRPRIAFYALRHTFETIGGESKDQVAVDWIMGHAVDSMAAQYRERVSDGRLQAVSDTVRQWLFADCDTGCATVPFPSQAKKI